MHFFNMGTMVFLWSFDKVMDITGFSLIEQLTLNLCVRCSTYKARFG